MMDLLTDCKIWVLFQFNQFWGLEIGNMNTSLNIVNLKSFWSCSQLSYARTLGCLSLLLNPTFSSPSPKTGKSYKDGFSNPGTAKSLTESKCSVVTMFWFSQNGIFHLALLCSVFSFWIIWYWLLFCGWLHLSRNGWKSHLCLWLLLCPRAKHKILFHWAAGAGTTCFTPVLTPQDYTAD